MANTVDFGLFDGLKVINPNSFPEEAWTTLTGKEETATDVEKFYSAVGYVYRCVNIRADAIASLPWRVDKLNAGKKDDPVWDNKSDDIPKQFEGFSEFTDLLYLTEASLCIYARAYWYKVGFPQRATFRWLMAETMTDKWDPELGLTHFERRLPKRIEPEILQREEVAYFALRNPLHETKPGVSPVQAACADASVIYSMDKFAGEYFKRGAIKATLLSVDRSMPERQRRELKAWWQRIIQGAKSAWNTVVLSNDVKATIIGEGFSELSDLDLARDKREGISTALGVPHSVVMSNAASYATANQDVQSFYEFTVVPAANKIQAVLNRDIFEPMGYRFNFMLDSINVFQEDENQRSAAFKTYVDAGLKKSLAAELLGIDLPRGMEYADLDEVEEEEVQEAPAAPAQTTTNQTEEQEQVNAEAKQFRNWARKRMNRVYFDPMEFEANHLSNHKKLEILEALGWKREQYAFGDFEDYP